MYKHKTSGEVAELSKFDSNFYVVSNMEVIPKRFIEESSDWEKVSVDDYEILSFISMRNRIYIKKGEYFYNEEVGWQRELSDFKIHSVKYLPTGEVLTIGDRCRYKYGNKIETIKGFVIRGGRIWVQNNLNKPNYGSTLEYTEKLKPLFVSEDGVEIFENDSYYLVSKDFKVGYCSKFSESDLDFILFSTKENAEKYIKENQPVFFTYDGKPVWFGDSFFAVHNNKSNIISWVVANDYMIANNNKTFKTFSTRELAEEYVKNNKQKYSLNDIEKAISKSLLIYSKPFVDKVIGNL